MNECFSRLVGVNRNQAKLCALAWFRILIFLAELEPEMHVIMPVDESNHWENEKSLPAGLLVRLYRNRSFSGELAKPMNMLGGGGSRATVEKPRNS